MAQQLNLFDNMNNVGKISEQDSTPQVTPFTTPSTASQLQPPSPQFTIERNPSPLKGFRVVQAPGLTHVTPKNPCLSCRRAVKGKLACSDPDKCLNPSLRYAYLEKIGTGGINVSVDFDVAYGC
jgi:hypothetical protein